MKRFIRNSVAIFGMARAKREAEYELSRGAAPALQHLVKLYLYPENDSREHWIDEIYSFLNDAPVLKHNKIFPSVKFILKNTYYAWEDSIDIKVRKIIHNYPKVDWNPELSKDFHNKALKYFTLLANKLSKEGYVTRSEVKSFLLSSGF